MSASFKYKPTKTGFEVIYRGKSIGEIRATKEASGRHCFYLAADDRREPRTYRGKIKASEALLTIHKLKNDAKKKKWSTDRLIIEAWDARPRASEAM